MQDELEGGAPVTSVKLSSAAWPPPRPRTQMSALQLFR